jgi:hypothetical protein
MAKKKRPNNLPIGGPFTPILNEIHDSLAYLKLSGSAAKLHPYLIRAARTVAFKIGAGSESLSQFDYTYSEAKRRGFSESTFKRAMKELWSLGFINVVAIGGLTASKERGRVSSKYQLSECWKTYGKQWRERTHHVPDPWKSPCEPKQGDHVKW